MSIPRHHAEWLSLVPVSGPFLSMPVLLRVFPQGLEAHDSERFRLLRVAYEEWEDNNQAGSRLNPAIHSSWIKFVLRNMLELPDTCIAEGQLIPQSLQTTIAQQDETLRPSLVILEPGTHKPRLLIQTYPATQDISKPVSGHTWKASPDTRMMELLHATGVRLGLVTNGEQWMLVDAPRNETTGFASWYAHLWLDEQITLRAFTSLLNAHRFFAVPEKDTLEAMLAESASNQQEVTDQLGYQVRKAVEVLVQSLDRADQDHGRELLASVPETELYEAALTIMMRLVFLFCAEERGLILLGDDIYDENYAVSTLEEQLRETADQHGEEILERRHDAWCRLLSTFRGVFGGIQHERMTLPPYGGKLFDPDRFPFLEGRKRGTTWKMHPASPLPVNNRTVLHLLDALQLLKIKVPGGGPAEARRLSFRALDIEQIGHVYEGLLDHTAKRAAEPVLGLAGSKNNEPEITLSKLEDVLSKGEVKIAEFLVEETGRSDKALKKALHEEIDLTNMSRFEAACGGSDEGNKLLQRIKPFVGLIRDDTFGYPVVIPKGSVYVTSGTDRRSSGTHYTPRSLTEPLAEYTLEPLVYIGPAEGKPKAEWKLRSAGELLDLKICDMACGSGSILLQAGRYMTERLLEAWEIAEKNNPQPPNSKLPFPTITPEGKPATGAPGETLIPKDTDERMAYARRIVAQRCLYGVDINPLAVEMAKLSLWLWTLAKDKPFTFLDHAIRCGDSLLGIHDLKQLKTFSLDGKGEFKYLFTQPLDEMVDAAIKLRLQIESMPSNTVEEVEAQARLMADCEQQVELLKCTADLLVAAELKGGNPREKLGHRDHAAIQVGHYMKEGKSNEFRVAALKELGRRRAFHWPLEFPEIVAKRAGFDAFVGNPPFLWGNRISSRLGDEYRDWLLQLHPNSLGNADLCVHFFRRANSLTRKGGMFGLIATNSIRETDNRVSGLDVLLQQQCNIIYAVADMPWPGVAGLHIAVVVCSRGSFAGLPRLDGIPVNRISAFLDTQEIDARVYALASQQHISFKGVDTGGLGFVVADTEEKQLLAKEPHSIEVLWPFINGEDFLSSPSQLPSRRIINFSDLDENQARRYCGPMALVEERVLPYRQTVKREANKRRWWLYNEPRPGLYETIRSFERVLVNCVVAKYICFDFLPIRTVFSNALNVFASDSLPTFGVLQSTIHDSWARYYGSSLETRQRYNPTDCFETFPFPTIATDVSNPAQAYYQSRQLRMEKYGEGLTDTYNRFHDSKETAKDIQKLRDLHVEMDKAVAAAYGWDDLKLDHGFHQTKQGLRFTISDPARREVLARLLKLNHERYAEEVAQGLHDKGKAGTKRSCSTTQGGLF